jgi:hypothetical protein
MFFVLASSTNLTSQAAELLTGKFNNEELVTLEESRPLVARSGAWQTLNEHIHVKPGQEKRRLILTFINGADGRAPLTDLHVQLARKPFATIKDFAGASSFSRDLTGALAVGNTPLTVQVFGPSGARLVWKLSTEKVVITAVKPTEFGSVDKVIVQGKNFSTNIKDNQALIGKIHLLVKSAKSDELKLEPSSHLPGGEQQLIILADSIKSNPVKVSVKGHPQVVSVNFLATSPGQPVTIYGSGFSRLASDNIVTFGTIKARVLSSTDKSITCIVPDMHFPTWHLPIKVTTHGMVSKGRVTINIDQRVIPNEGVPML